MANFQGSFLSYLNSISDSAHGFSGGFTQSSIASLTSTQLDQILGAYGVDPSSGNHDVWAVINHNSQFAVVPEPSTLLLAALGLAGSAVYRRRRKLKSGDLAPPAREFRKTATAQVRFNEDLIGSY